jgi:hypothetical protein
VMLWMSGFFSRTAARLRAAASGTPVMGCLLNRAHP